MSNQDFYLSALVDFPDDCGEAVYTREGLNAMAEALADIKVKRLYWQWYGDARNRQWWDSRISVGSDISPQNRQARAVPDFNRVVVEAAKRLGMSTVGIMRCQESGNAGLYSEFYPEVRKLGEREGIPSAGGYTITPDAYLLKNPESRIKRRTWDIDEEAERMNICTIELRKQNARPTRIRKENIEIFVSEKNYNYRKYEGEFGFIISAAVAEEDVVVTAPAADGSNYGRATITRKGETVTAIRLTGLNISEPFVAVVCRCGAPEDSEDRDAYFCNTLNAAIRCYAGDGRLIPVNVGNNRKVWRDPEDRDWRECGCLYDGGFGDYFEFTLDPPEGEGLYAISRGKNRYVHSDLCECDPGVQDWWMKCLDQCIEDGYDMISHRVENHSLMMDEPFAYGYNDSIKELYYRRYGKCDESLMDPKKIAKVRGDVFSELFRKGAERTRAAGRKVVLMLNTEMLHNPIPLSRRFAYPMNVEWQWERWLEEIQPDEITLRTFCYSPEFVLSDPQCMNILRKAKATGAPITYERYLREDFVRDYRTVRDSGYFTSITLYEVANVLKSDGAGGVIEKCPELFRELRKM